MYFIEQSPLSNGYTATLIIIDRLSKEGVYTPTTILLLPYTLQRSSLRTFSPSTESRCMSLQTEDRVHLHFFRALDSLLRIRLQFTLGHHPGANSLIERIYNTQEQSRCIHYNYQQDNWPKLSPLAGSASSNAPHVTTCVSSFATRRYDPLIGMFPDAEVIDLRAIHFVINFNEIHRLLRERMSDAQDTMSKYAHQERINRPPFRVGDRVYEYTDHIRTNRTSQNLTEKNIGPFPIISLPSVMSFTLCLPATIRIHSVFHVLQLEPEDPKTFEGREQPPPPLIVDGKAEYLIERIIDSKYNRTRNQCQLLYYIQWAGYPLFPISCRIGFGQHFRRRTREALHRRLSRSVASKTGSEMSSEGAE